MKKKLELLALSALVTFPIATLYAQSTSQPNVIYILADDLGIGDLGCYGQKKIKTPGIDKLANNGMLFTQHYSGSTVSAPSRCCLMTGKHTGHSAVRGNSGSTSKVDGLIYDSSLPNAEITVAEIMKQKNYATACIGKWGLGGPGAVGNPNNQGFDYFFGYLGQGHAHRYFTNFLWENDTKIELDGKTYSHDLIMDKALAYIEKNADKPFFLYLSPTIPHADIIVPEGERGEYENAFYETPYINQNKKGKGYISQPKPNATYAAMVSKLDKDVQRIMDLLEAKGLTENTIVMFTSDNGNHSEGGHDPSFFDSNGPFRGIKRDLYEGGIRTPFVLQWPVAIPKGSISYHISAFWDLLPTMCDLLNVKNPAGIDGISFLPELTGKGKQEKHDYLYWEFHERGGKRAVLKDNWKLIELFVNEPDKTTMELYYLNSDPGENANVIHKYPDVVEKLKPYLEKARTKNQIWNFKSNAQLNTGEINL